MDNYLAGLATGVWSGLDELRALRTLEQHYTPNMEAPVRERLLRGWHKAVGRSLKATGVWRIDLEDISGKEKAPKAT